MSVEEYKRLRNKGKEQLNEGNSQKAVEYFTRALKEANKLLEREPEAYSPEFPPQEIRVTCQNLPEHDAKACQFCRKYLELAVCYSNRAFGSCNLKAYEAALLDAEEAIHLAPEWSKVNEFTKHLNDLNFV